MMDIEILVFCSYWFRSGVALDCINSDLHLDILKMNNSMTNQPKPKSLPAPTLTVIQEEMYLAHKRGSWDLVVLLAVKSRALRLPSL